MSSSGWNMYVKCRNLGGGGALGAHAPPQYRIAGIFKGFIFQEFRGTDQICER